ncbi:hypothetical protein I3843_13G082100 [Carya illinoinensis]|nr:hypothetical protein I3760_13G094500 [Carya illinoinensis]KAG7949816.1 hypothetical protein I3843_13G082100 [Carya illinoinensis]
MQAAALSQTLISDSSTDPRRHSEGKFSGELQRAAASNRQISQVAVWSGRWSVETSTCGEGKQVAAEGHVAMERIEKHEQTELRRRNRSCDGLEVASAPVVGEWRQQSQGALSRNLCSSAAG